MKTILSWKDRREIRKELQQLQQHFDDLFLEMQAKHNFYMIPKIKKCMDDINQLKDLLL